MRKLFSTRELYKKVAQGEIAGFTVPAFNVRLLSFDIMRTIFRSAQKEKTAAFILEIAESEIDYTKQSLKEYRKTALEAAEKENFNNPIFLQGDHFKGNNLEELVSSRALENGFYNIDLDFSSLSIKENAQKMIYFTNFIRKIRPDASIGAEVGEIGGKNTKLEEFERFMEIYGRGSQLSKIAIQTGTSHGGEMLPSGELKTPDEDFRTLTEISQRAKDYGLAGAVQHGGSTLPKEMFSKFPATGCCEIHLATQFQNMVFDSEYFPENLRKEIYNWLRKNCQKEKNENDIQFIYKNRKKALGKFKEKINNISQKEKICQEMEKEFRFLFKSLKVSNTENLIRKIYC